MSTTAQTERQQDAGGTTAAANPIIMNVTITRPIPGRTATAIARIQADIDAATGRLIQAHECGRRAACDNLFTYRLGLEKALAAIVDAYR